MVARPAELEYLVLSQQSATTLEVPAWAAQARRFFGTTLEQGATEGAIALIASSGARDERRVRARRRTEGDLRMADAAEARAGGGGLALLARRCPVVWHVERHGEMDATALRLAAILASVLLGPIVDPSGPDIFGVKTARGRLDRLTPDR